MTPDLRAHGSGEDRAVGSDRNARPGRQPRRAPAAAAALGANVMALDVRRIEKAIAQRTRYKYVRPRIEREGSGWKVVSPNCSRNISPDGSEIDIAWLVPANEGLWLLYARDHAQACWALRRHGALPALLEHLSSDPQREFWQ